MIVSTKDAIDIAKNSYTELSKYTIRTRTYASMIDGLKPVYRRTIYASLPIKTMSKSAKIVGNGMMYHPHGDGNIYSALVSMASKYDCRYPLYDTNGNFGGLSYQCAAMRYTEACLSDFGRTLIGEDLIKYAEYIEGDAGYQEPLALPMLIPYVLLTGGGGFGVGMPNPEIPSLDALDVIDVYLDKTSGKSPRSIPRIDVGDCIIYGSKREVDDVVCNGGPIWYRGLVHKLSDTMLLVTSFTPSTDINKILKKLSWYIDRDEVTYINESKTSERHIFILESTKNLTPDKFYSLVRKALSCKVTYKWILEKDSIAYICGAMDIIDTNLKYLRECVVRKYSSIKLEALSKIEVLNAIDWMKSSGLLSKLPNMSKQEVISIIVSESEFSEDVAKQALSKSISYLTNSHSEEFENLKSTIDQCDIYINDPDSELHSRYLDLRSKIMDRYNSIGHTEISETGEVAYVNKGSLCKYEDSWGINISKHLKKNYIKWNNCVNIILKDGTIRTVMINRKESYLDNIGMNLSDVGPEDVVALVSDNCKYIVLVEDDSKILARKIDSLSDNTNFVKVTGNITQAYGLSSSEAIINDQVIINVEDYITSRKSKLKYISKVDNIVSIKDH